MQKITCQQIKDHFSDIFLETSGPLNNGVSGISALENIRAGTLVYLLNDRSAALVAGSQASAVIAPLNLKDKIEMPKNQTWLLCHNPELAMARVKSHFFLPTPYRAPLPKGVHPKAFVDSTAQVAETATVAPGAFVGAGVVIGERSFVGAGAVVEANTVIGHDSVLHPLSYVGHSCVIGNRCEIKPQACVGSEGYGYAHDEKGAHHRIPHSGRVVLEDDVHVGAGSCIDRGSIEDSIVRQGTKIDNLCHLAHNSVVGRHGLLTSQFVMAGSSSIGDHFIAGGNVAVTGHVKVGNGVQLAGRSVITKDLLEPGQYGGYPLEKLQDFLKTKAALVQLKDLRKQVNALVKGKK